ncbi:MAG TPA: AmmeMemoRadiSam system radical SAM enzyme, partial [Aggregatilineales bacterium]|nr:AmmeMemoRadiSam system radical SAM enzyme [Aggregatilineales bacterium]
MTEKDMSSSHRVDRSIIPVSELRKPIAGEVPVSKIINPMVREGELYEKLEDGAVHCYSCAHDCTIKPGGRGICQVRYNLGGKLYVPYGYVAALQCDPTEKKPFNHLHPGSDTLTFGMLGCDLHCSYCQNWDISQTLRDANAGRPPREITAAELAQMAVRNGAKNVASSYNEPLITSEWAAAVFKEAKKYGLTCAYISNGNATRGVLEYIRPFTDAYKVDLKTMNDKNYRKLGGVLEHILDGIRMVHEMGFWLEVVTLVIPGFNDSPDELWDAARFLASLSPDIPWHVTAFHKDYKMTDPDDTDSRTLIQAAEIGYEAGLNYVYAGNMPGRVEDFEHTFCPNCHTKLIGRYGYVVTDYQITSDGRCPKCKTKIAGIFPSKPSDVHTGTLA